MTKSFAKDYLLSNWNKIREILYLLLLFSYVLLRIYNTSWVQLSYIIPYFDSFTAFLEQYIFPVLLICLYIVNLLLSKEDRNYKKIIFNILLLAAFLAGSLVHYDCAVVCAFLMCADFTSIKNITKYSAISITFGTICVIIASQIGFAGDHIVERMGRSAHYFGFYHYAIWARQLLFAGVSYLYVRAKKTTVFELIVFAALSYLVFYFSTQRLTLACCILLVVVFIVFTKYEIIKINNKIISSLAAIAFPVATFASILVCYYYDSSIAWMKALNKFLNTRVSLGHHAFELFDFNLFGQIVHHTTDYYFYIDNGYLYLLFSYGLVISVIVLFCYSYMYWRSCKTNNTALFTWLTISLVYLLVDNTAVDLTCTAIILLAFPVLLKEHIKEIKSRNIK